MVVLYRPPISPFPIFLHSLSLDWEKQVGISLLCILLPSCMDISMAFRSISMIWSSLALGGGGGKWGMALRFICPQRSGMN